MPAKTIDVSDQRVRLVRPHAGVEVTREVVDYDGNVLEELERVTFRNAEHADRARALRTETGESLSTCAAQLRAGIVDDVERH